MAAIITDQIRILNAKNFVAGVATTSNSYYSFIGLPNPSEYQSDWDENPPSPLDNLDEENNYWDTAIALKNISSSDIRLVVPKRFWNSGTTYDMYRHDYSIINPARSGATTLYAANYFVINSDYRVYICLQNGTTPENPTGLPSLDEPTFVDLEPKAAGISGDGYIWKYLYTIKPSEISKFESVDFMPVPSNWETSDENAAVRDNAVDGSIKIVSITNRGVGVGTANRTYTRVPIKGDGDGAECTVTINADQEVDSVIISSQGSGYTYGNVDLNASDIPQGSTNPLFSVIISPQGGHGADIYKELGAKNVLLYSRIENDVENPDFIIGNQIARIGIIRNPKAYDSIQNLNIDKASALYALKLIGAASSTTEFTPDAIITQKIGTGVTAAGRVVNYDPITGVLKYWQDRTLAGFTTTPGAGIGVTNPVYGYNLNKFTSSPTGTGNLEIVQGTTSLGIDTSFTGISTVINNRTYYLGQSFTNGISNPEVKKYSGEIIYVDNRPSITRSTNQKEDIKVILQF
jgi:hypothetical protein